jgi:two-component system sensor histidine kinase BaeS
MRANQLPLAYRLFGAISLTALLVVVVMASMVAINMREGFSRYLLRGELELHKPLVETLAAAHDASAGGWPQLASHPEAWARFIRANDPRPPEPPGRGAPPMPIERRLILLDAHGNHVSGGDPAAGQPEETIAIMAPGAPPNAAPIGWLGIAAPGMIQSSTDALFLRSQFRSLIVAALLALALSALAAALLARQFLVPIRALERGAKRLAGGEYAARIPNERGDELGQLIGHYNALAENLESAERAQQQWISDTSHELQTPLAVLRAHIEALQDGVRQADPPTLDTMEEAVTRLTHLIADLRLLSDWREGALTAQSGPANLADIARDAVAATSEQFSAAGLELTTDVADPIRVKCDAGRIRQVLDNLLANSLRYTDAPGEVRLRAWRSGERAYLTLDDAPPAPPDETMPHLFDRFFRADASRSRAGGGSGLGLAICKAIVEAHGGEISATRSRFGGLNVCVILPAREPE